MAFKKRVSSFWKIYIAVGVLLFAALGIWLMFLYGWLGDFESAQPKYLAEETFNEYFAEFNAEEYVKLCNPDTLPDTEENTVAYLNSVTDGKEISYKKVSTGMDSGYKYVVTASDGTDEVKFASFMLVEDGSSGDGYTKYKADNFELYTSSNSQITVEAPKGYTVIVNEMELTEDNIIENDIPTPSCDHMPEGVSGLYYTKYLIKGLLSEPVVTVKGSDGTDAVVVEDGHNYKAEPIYDAALEAEYTEWVLEGVENYAKYNQYDSNVNVTGFNKVAPYFDPNSELYESIKTVDNMFVIHYDKYEFTDMTASEFYRYDENTFSCRVQYTQNLYKGDELYDDVVDQTLYLRLVDGKYLIYDMNVN